MSQHTPGPWSQGITLITGQTKKWTPEQIEENNRRERRMIFAGFTASDKGRSRKYIAVCDSEDDARHIVNCVNACAGMVDPADEIEKLKAAQFPDYGLAERCDELQAQCYTLLAALRETRVDIARVESGRFCDLRETLREIDAVISEIEVKS